MHLLTSRERERDSESKERLEEDVGFFERMLQIVRLFQTYYAVQAIVTVILIAYYLA